MALLFFDGFDHYNTGAHANGKWTSPGGTVSSPTRFGVGRSFGGNQVTAEKRGLPAGTTWYAGCALYMSSNGFPMLYFMTGTSLQVAVVCQSDGKFRINRNDGTAIAGPSTGIYSLSTWYFMELKAVFGTSTGSVELRINGTTILTGSSVNTGQAGGSSYDGIHIGWSPNVQDIKIDDLYLCDSTGSANNNFLGDLKVETLYPTSDSSVTWTKNGGSSNFGRVSEQDPDEDTTYVSDSNAGDIDRYGKTTLAMTGGTVFGIQLNVRARKDDAGSRTLRTVIRSGGTNYEGSDYSVLDNYENTLTLRETDPATSAAWTISNVNAAEIGQKMQA